MNSVFLNWHGAIFVCLMLTLISEQSARAELARHLLRGTITEVESPLDSLFTVGQPVAYQMTIDMATPDASTSSVQGAYLRALHEVHAVVGGYSFEWIGERLIYVDNDIDPGTGPIDRFHHSLIPHSLPSFGTYDPAWSYIIFEDDDASAFASNALSELPPSNLTAFETATINFSWSYPNSGRDFGQVVASIDSWEIVPEPNGIGLVGMCGLAWILLGHFRLAHSVIPPAVE